MLLCVVGLHRSGEGQPFLEDVERNNVPFTSGGKMLRYIIGLCLMGTACHDSGLSTVSDDGAGNWPVIEVTPGLLNYGDMETGDVKAMTFTVRNVGLEGSTLAVDGIDIESATGGGFTILEGTDDDFGIGVGDEREITVVFSPAEPSQNIGQAIVHSNDDRNPEMPVDLRGFGLMPRLFIDPNPHDYGTVNIGCTSDQTFRLTNVGTETLTLTDLSGLGSGFEALEVPYMPLMLDPGESTELQLRFNPTNDVAYDGDFVVDSNDPYGAQTAVYRGLGHVPTAVEDRWNLPEDPPVDILWYVDQSGSMNDDQEALSSNFSTFIDNIERITSDWHVAVVTQDGGCANTILSPRDSDYIEAFTSAVSDGDETVHSEAGFTLLTQALNQTEDGDCNEGFLRDDSMLHVIMVSDEPEQSATPWSSFVSELHELRTDPGLVKVSAIAGDLPNGCETPDNSAKAGIGYYEATVATKGVFLPFCSYWSNEVDTLAEASTNRPVFPLSSTADPATIQVRVNERSVPRGWEYDESRNAVVFTSDYPGSGDEVVIDYHEPNICL